MTRLVPVVAVRRLRGRASRTLNAVRRLAALGSALGLALGSAGCVLTQDLPDPALDVPTQYKYAGKPDAPPPLDWWRVPDSERRP